MLRLTAWYLSCQQNNIDTPVLLMKTWLACELESSKSGFKTYLGGIYGVVKNIHLLGWVGGLEGWGVGGCWYVSKST